MALSYSFCSLVREGRSFLKSRPGRRGLEPPELSWAEIACVISNRMKLAPIALPSIGDFISVLCPTSQAILQHFAYVASSSCSRRKHRPTASHSELGPEPSRSHTRSRRLAHQSRTRRNCGCGTGYGSGRGSGYCPMPCDRSNPEHVRQSLVP